MKPGDSLTEHFRLTEGHRNALRRLGILTVRDLLFHFPFRYEQGGSENTVSNLEPGKQVTIFGRLEKLNTRKSWKSRVPIAEGYIRDQSGRVKAMWFHQPYIAKMYQEGTFVKAVGKVGGSPGKIYLANPELSPADPIAQNGSALFESGAVSDDKLYAQYPETRGVTSLWFRHTIEKILGTGILDTLTDPIPADILERYHLPRLKTALLWVHAPKDPKNAEAARKRFAFEEVFFIQLEKQQERKRESLEKGFRVESEPKDISDFIDSFPFKATGAQKKAIEGILSDFKRGHPMSRLLEGDVGSGKTAVAATTAYAVVRTRPIGQFGLPALLTGRQAQAGNLQVAYMAPTEILAKQHFESFIRFFDYFPVNIGLITGSGCKKFPSKISRDKSTDISRSQLLKWVSNGEIPILIGTHALIQKEVRFKHLAYVVIDEQHRFGTNQRKKLARKDVALPHLLSMTATPIPRTLALTIYGDLDLTLLDEMPAGRKVIITDVLKSSEREKAYTRMREEIAQGRQAYVICPRIDEPDPEKELALNAKSVKEEAKRLKQEVFPDLELDILHSKMKPKEKDEAMQKFAEGKTHILVATSVVEVGVNVPNATVILIEGAEHFGLSQLHQLRGRVVRSNHQAFCFALAESQGKQTLERLRAFKTAKNGFELAELDLMQRGPGELSGRKQWGISDIGMEALKNLKLVEAARNEAAAIIEDDVELAKHPRLKEIVEARTAKLHFE